MLRGMALSVATCAAALIVLIPTAGNHGLRAALIILNTLRGLTLWRASPQPATKAR